MDVSVGTKRLLWGSLLEQDDEDEDVAEDDCLRWYYSANSPMKQYYVIVIFLNWNKVTEVLVMVMSNEVMVVAEGLMNWWCQTISSLKVHIYLSYLCDFLIIVHADLLLTILLTTHVMNYCNSPSNTFWMWNYVYQGIC